jgi:hypothetical protein
MDLTLGHESGRNLALQIVPPGTLVDASAHRLFLKESRGLSRRRHPTVASATVEASGRALRTAKPSDRFAKAGPSFNQTESLTFPHVSADLHSNGKEQNHVHGKAYLSG